MRVILDTNVLLGALRRYPKLLTILPAHRIGTIVNNM